MVDWELARWEFAEKLDGFSGQKHRLSARDLIDQQMEFARVFVDNTSEDEIQKIQEYTRALGHPWAVSFLVYIINEGIVQTLSKMASVIRFPDIFPVTPSARILKTWGSAFVTKEPYTGDIVLAEDYAGVIVSSNHKRQTLKMIGGDVRKLVKTESGKKMTVGVFEISRGYNDEVVFLDMQKMYDDFLKKARQQASEVVEDLSTAI